MNYYLLLKQLAINALFWTGLAAVAITLVQGNVYFALFFAGLVAVNLLLIFVLQRLAPNAFKINEPGKAGQLVFKLKPIKYPKILDEEKRAYLPEFIHLDISIGRHIVYAGDLARSVLKNLRDSLDQALSTEETKTSAVQEKVARKKSR